MSDNLSMLSEQVVHAVLVPASRDRQFVSRCGHRIRSAWLSGDGVAGRQRRLGGASAGELGSAVNASLNAGNQAVSCAEPYVRRHHTVTAADPLPGDLRQAFEAVAAVAAWPSI